MRRRWIALLSVLTVVGLGYVFYFTSFLGVKSVDVVGAPAGCQMKLERPSDGTATAQKLNEQTFMNGGENSNYGAMFANKITVDCP